MAGKEAIKNLQEKTNFQNGHLQEIKEATEKIKASLNMLAAHFDAFMSNAMPPPRFLSRTRKPRCAQWVSHHPAMDNEPTVQAPVVKAAIVQASNHEVDDDDGYVGDM